LIGPLFVFGVALLVVLWLLWRPRSSIRWRTINVKDGWIDLRPERKQRRSAYFNMDRNIAHA
jgi:hypothetical protein